MKLFIASLFTFLIVSGSYSQNINHPTISAGPKGLKVNTYTGGIIYERQDLVIPCQGLNIDLTFYFNSSTNAVDIGYGNGWTMTYSMLYERSGQVEIYIRGGDGRKDKYFCYQTLGCNPSAAGYFDILSEYEPGKFQLQKKDGTKYFFDDDTHKRLTKITDRNNNQLTITYTNSLATTITDQAGRSIQLNYTNGHLSSITDANTIPPRQFQYNYDENWNTTAVTDPLGYSINYEYHLSNRRMIKLIDQSGYQYSFAYTNFTNSVSQITSPVNILNFYYQLYDPSLLTVKEMVNNIEQVTSYNYGYNNDNNIRSKSGNCCGFNESYDYDTQNNMIKKTDANSREWNYTYDSKGNRKSETDPIGGITEYTYEPLYNHMTSKKDKRGNITTYVYDTQGNLLHENKPLGISEHNTYDAYGNVTSHTDGKGNVTSYQYNSCGDRTLIIYPDGSTNSFTYDAVGNKKTFTDANGNTTTYSYDLLNRLTQTQNALGNSTNNTYDGKGNLITVTDELGHVTSYVYDALDRKTKIITPAGTTTMTYDEKGNMLTRTDGNGNITRYSYDTRNLLVSEKDALNHSRSFAYDNIGNKVTETDFSGHTTNYIYDHLNRMTKKTEELMHTTDFTYDANGNRTSVTDANGHITSYDYDELNRLVMTQRARFTTSTAYDNNNNVTLTTDANGNATQFIFDNMDRRTGMIDALGHETYFKYDPNGNNTEILDRIGNVTAYNYDALNRRIQEINALGEITSTVYNAVGNVISRTIPSGNTTTFNYDAANRMISSSDLSGLIGTYVYDANSNRVNQTDGIGHSTVNKYDALNRLIRVRDAMGKNTSYTYNNNSSMTSMQDRNGRTTTFIYDALERKTSTTSPAGNNTTMSYDNAGNLKTITDDNGRTTIYDYDANDRLITETYANGTSKSYTYDLQGNIKTRRDNNGLITPYGYDALNRLISRADENFAYDLEGHMLTANNSNANITYTYDNAYRKVSENMNGKTTGYSYDIPGRKRTMTYPGGRSVVENYDTRMRLTNIASGINVSYTLDAGNRILTRTYSNGVVSNYTYNDNDWMTSVSHVKTPSLIAQFNYTLDNEGNRLTAQKIHRPTNSEKYSYDLDDRLINYKEGTLSGNDIPSPLTQTQFNYDGVGNRTTIVKDASTTTYTANNVNAYTSIIGGGTTTPAYDLNGNTTNDGTHTYAFDFENQLISADGGATAAYKYDALGRRIQKVTSTGTINYYYDDQRIIEERDGLDVAKATYIYGTWIDDILSMNRGGNNYFYHQNSLGSIAAVTDNSGAAAERYEYDAYGKAAIYNGLYSPLASTAIGNTYMFTGREYDAEIKTYHYRARFYKPDWGRFGQWDPPGIWSDYLNLGNGYRFVYDNPLKYVDPNGNNPYVIGGLGLGVGLITAFCLLAQTHECPYQCNPNGVASSNQKYLNPLSGVEVKIGEIDIKFDLPNLIPCGWKCTCNKPPGDCSSKE